MTRVGTVRLTTGLVAAALAAGAGGILPSPARADDGMPAALLPPEASTAAPTLDAGDTVAAVDDEIAAVIDVADAVDASLPSSEAPAGTPAVPELAPDAADAPEGDGEATSEREAEIQEKSGDATDTALDTAPGTTPALASPGPTVAQSSPANVNVSVRIGSPGDDGAVTQVNVAAAVTPSATAAAAPATQVVTSSTSGASQAPQAAATHAVVSPGASTAISPTASATGGWTWQWDCLTAPSFDGLSPSGSDEGSTPSNWTWIWNCGENTSQYRNATVGQYQPVNVNVSIRVGSPGNNGPVQQSNVAVGVVVGSSSGAAAAGVSAQGSPSISEASSSGLALPAIPTFVVVAPVAVLAPVAAAAPEAAKEIAAVEEALDLLLPSLEPVVSFPLAPAIVAGSLVGGRRLRPVPFTIGPRGELVATRPALGPSGRPVPSLRASTVGAQAAAPPSRAAKRAKRASRWQAPTDTGSAPKRAPSGTSASAAGAGGSSSGSLPIFLALPFLAAMLDLARRVALERFATPSGHRSRIPDTPG